jgi:hypothetical protein
MTKYFTPAQVRNYVNKQFLANGENYAKTAQELGVNVGVVWKLVNGQQEDSPTIRRNCNMPKCKRYRLAAEFATEEERQRFKRDCLRGLSFTEWVMKRWEYDRQENEDMADLWDYHGNDILGVN